MLQPVFKSANPPFCWLDIVEPSRADLEAAVKEYGLFRTAVEDCLDPEHLPKFERFDGTSFLILRAIDEKAPLDADTIQALTRKVAIFYAAEFLVTIHRKEQEYLSKVKKEWASRAAQGVTAIMPDLLGDIVNAAIDTYEAPLEEAEARLDGFETGAFQETDVTTVIRDVYLVKRRVTLAKRLLWRMLGLVSRAGATSDRTSPLFQDLRENAESMHFYADELLEDVNNLLHMQISIASHRTNEVMRVLTIFSAFFLPLTFVVGIYGMNFHFMPELSQAWGYPMIWVFMLSISIAIYLWFRRRGWL